MVEAVVRDMAPDKVGGTIYELGYFGVEREKLREYILSECKRRGLEVLEVREDLQGDGRWRVAGVVRSFEGIV